MKDFKAYIATQPLVCAVLVELPENYDKCRDALSGALELTVGNSYLGRFYTDDVSERRFALDGVEYYPSAACFTVKDTVACLTLKYQGKEYYLEQNFGKGYREETARFMFYDGNYSCDCNKSIFLNQKYGDEFPELECGDEIEIVSFKVEYR